MRLRDRFESWFSADTRFRGAVYAQSGAVEVARADATSVRAFVRGSRRYEVTIGFARGVVSLACSCPYVLRNDPCKHLWATVLAAETRDALGAVMATRNALEMTLSGTPSSTRAPADDGRRADGDDRDGGDRDGDERDGGERDGDERDGDGDERDDRDTEGDDDDRDDAGEDGDAGGGDDDGDAAGDGDPVDVPAWQAQLETVAQSARYERAKASREWPPGRELVYCVDVLRTLRHGSLVIETATRERKARGGWSRPRARSIEAAERLFLPDAADRRIVALLAGPSNLNDLEAYYGPARSRFALDAELASTVVPMMAATGRLLLVRDESVADPPVLAWDASGPYALHLAVARTPTGSYELTGGLQRGETLRSLTGPVLLTAGGLVFDENVVAALDDGGAFAWVPLLRKARAIEVPADAVQTMVTQLLGHPALPQLDLPDELRVKEEPGRPTPRVRIAKPSRPGDARLNAMVLFDYGADQPVAFDDARAAVLRTRDRTLVRRDREAESRAMAQFRAARFRAETTASPSNGRAMFTLAAKDLPVATRELAAAGWRVEAEGRLYRTPGDVRMAVRSGVDWFDLEVTVDFGNGAPVAKLPALLAAMRRGEDFVRLDDGTMGFLPEAWLQQFGGVLTLAKTEGDAARFTRNQAVFLDALLVANPRATFDDGVAAMRSRLQGFDGIATGTPPDRFVGTLRPYQQRGLDWMRFLEAFQLGGCLADDMGLGKTVMVLALLAGRRREEHGPSLVVVPRSLVFNWQREAARFAPSLRVLDYTRATRRDEAPDFAAHDIVLATYGTLRSDITTLADVQFDYAILDEAQAIKNASTASAKASRLLHATHRLALSGTPIENHLGELWSLFEFLDPGLLGGSTAFDGLQSGSPERAAASREMLARALRPLILRRTKSQVAPELPERTDQTLFCVLEPAQRKLYDELREHYRTSLLTRVDTSGLGRSKIHVLEALLRLRQAACHVGLIDKETDDAPSAKFDVLVPRLEEVAAEGRKALVFSQFTSLLSLLRARLDAAKIPYEYLDGATRDREARVTRYQNDPACPLFLISLKAGGLGLNLTAADTVFLLDPWWNPAVEAQAIDRAHRIGQTRRVFACRLIAKDTVEEKVLELQQRKRGLADAIINADNSLIRDLSRDDLELLLG